MLCKYGCGQEGIFQTRLGDWCCSKYPSQCPVIKKKNSEKRKLQISEQKEKGTYINNFHNKNKKPWNKGLTKESDKRLLKQGNTLKERFKNGTLIQIWLGHKHSE